MAWELALGMLALAGLATFIVWECFSSRKLSRQELGKGFRPGWAAKQTALLILAAFFVYFGIEEWIQPSHPPFEGRGAMFVSLLYAALGPRGLPLLCWALGAGTTAMLVAHWRKR